MEEHTIRKAKKTSNTSNINKLKHTGFGNLTDGYELNPLSLDEYLIPHPSSTFFLFLKGKLYAKEPEYKERILVVDRSLPPSNNKLLIINLHGEFVLRLYTIDPTTQTITLTSTLHPENKIEISKNEVFEYEGVVSHIINTL